MFDRELNNRKKQEIHLTLTRKHAECKSQNKNPANSGSI